MAEIAIKIRVEVAVVLGGPLIYFAWLVIFLGPNYWVEILQKNLLWYYPFGLICILEF